MDWLIPTYTPTWLRVAGLTTAARQLSELPPILNACDLETALVAPIAARRETAHAPPRRRSPATAPQPSREARTPARA